MTALRINDLLEHSHPRLNPQKIRRFAEIVDDLPSVVVFETEFGLLLVDGYHRVGAAKLRGRDTIQAEIKQGSRHEALQFALALNMKEGTSRHETMARIQQLSADRWGGGPPRQ
jgi:ParB-like chromosome segregation protein Spo0J